MEGTVGHLKSNILHFTCELLSEHLKTMDRYTTLAAEQLVEQKKEIGWTQLALDPPWTFFKTYFLHRGFLDGIEGLAIAHMAALYNFVKYAKAKNAGPREVALFMPAHRLGNRDAWQAMANAPYLIRRTDRRRTSHTPANAGGVSAHAGCGSTTGGYSRVESGQVAAGGGGSGSDSRPRCARPYRGSAVAQAASGFAESGVPRTTRSRILVEVPAGRALHHGFPMREAHSDGRRS